MSALVHDRFNFCRREDLDTFTSDTESLFIEFDKMDAGTTKNVIVGVIYRPPNTNLDNFLDYIKDVLDRINKENKICYLTGDYNLNLFNT